VKKLFLALPAFLVSCSNSGGDNSSALKGLPISVPVDAANLDIGKGVNTLTGILPNYDMAFCVKRASMGYTGGTGANSTVEVYWLKDQNELSRIVESDFSLEVGINASIKKNLIGATYNSTTKNIAEFRLESTHSYALMTASRIFASNTMSDFDVDPKIIDIYSKHPEDWFDSCGDEFISSLISGIVAYGLIDCEATSVTDKEKNEKVIQAGVNSWSIHANVKDTKSLEEMQKNVSGACHIWYYHLGGNGTLSIAGDNISAAPQIFLDYVEKAPIESAKLMKVGTTPYTMIQNLDFKEKVLPKIKHDYNAEKQLVLTGQQNFNEMFNQLTGTELLLAKYKKDYSGISETEYKKLLSKKIDLEYNLQKQADFNYNCAKHPNISSACNPDDGWL